MKLFTPISLSGINLSHRVVMAPLTRSRAKMPGNVPSELMLRYYTQRASEGGLIISEGTNVSASSRGWYGAPAIYNDAHIEGWKRITDAVHAKGGSIFAQLWHTGRSSHVDVTEGIVPVSASVDPTYWADASHLTSTPTGWVAHTPHRSLETSEIPAVIEEFRSAAAHAKTAGFDGVELHGANGYLIDQFLQDGSNKRLDNYGGPISNRARLLLEIVEVVANVWGGDRVAVRIGPNGRWNGMSDSNPQALFAHIADRLNRFGLAYLHIIEPRVKGNILAAEGQPPIAAEQLRKIFLGPIIVAGGFEPSSAEAIIEKGDADLVAFGRYFVSNPDLPMRIRENLGLNEYDRATFYTFDERGYIDYPFVDAVQAAA